MKRNRLPAIPRMKGSFTGPSVKFLTSWSDLPREADHTNDDGSDPDEDLYTGAEKLIRSKLGEGRTNPSFVPSDMQSDPYRDDAGRAEMGRSPRNPKLVRRLGSQALASRSSDIGDQKVTTRFGTSVIPSLSDTLKMDALSKGVLTGDTFSRKTTKHMPWNSQHLLNHKLFWGNHSEHPKAKEASAAAIAHAKGIEGGATNGEKMASKEAHNIAGHQEFWADKARDILIRKALKNGIISKAGLHPVTKKMRYAEGPNHGNFMRSFTNTDVRSHDAHEHGTAGSGPSGFGELLATGVGNIAIEVNSRPSDLHDGSKFHNTLRSDMLRGLHEIGHGRG